MLTSSQNANRRGHARTSTRIGYQRSSQDHSGQTFEWGSGVGLSGSTPRMSIEPREAGTRWELEGDRYLFPAIGTVVPGRNPFSGVALRAGLLRAPLPLGLPAVRQPADRCAPYTSLTQTLQRCDHHPVDFA